MSAKVKELLLASFEGDQGNWFRAIKVSDPDTAQLAYFEQAGEIVEKMLALSRARIEDQDISDLTKMVL